MKRTLSIIQFLQLKRELQNAGIVYSMLFFVILAIVYYLFFNFVQSFYGSIITPSLVVFIIFGIHRKRVDKTFVLRHIPKPRRNFTVQYLLFSAPLLLPLFWSEFPWLILTSVLLIVLIVNSKPQKLQKADLLWLPKIINKENFEWLAGVRKNFYIILILWLISLLLLNFPFAVMIPLFFISNIIISFYQEDEPQHILKLHLNRPGSFLRRKCIRALLPMLFLYVGPLAAAAFLYPESWYIYLLFLLMQIVAIEFSIFHKYKMYLPNTRNNKNEIILGIVVLFSIIPFFLPLPFLFAFREYFLAKKTLKLYTND